VRQVLGAISEFDKAMTVAKLRGARERKRRQAGKWEGRKSHAERNPELLGLAKRLHRQKPKERRMSLQRERPPFAAASQHCCGSAAPLANGRPPLWLEDGLAGCPMGLCGGGRPNVMKVRGNRPQGGGPSLR
jgi:hypothetical protein